MKHGSDYVLTPAGADLEPVFMMIGEWAVRWAFITEPADDDQLDPVPLLWWMHRRIDVERLPDRRVVVEFDLRGATTSRLWLLLERSGPSVCIKFPGFDPDLVVTAPVRELYRAFGGRTTFADALAAGSIRVDGPPKLARALPTWFQWSPFYTAMRAAVSSGSPSAPARP
ncbi:MAG: hypothetical protein ACRD0G_15715 [Acidimicrobiales bacterium]